MKLITKWRVGVSFLILFSTLIYFYSKSRYSEDKYMRCKHFYKAQYFGIIDEIHKRGRISPIYLLRNSEWFWPYLHRDSVEVLLQLGDSIYKPSKSFDLYIYKNANPDSVIYLPYDFDCNSLVEKD